MTTSTLLKGAVGRSSLSLALPAVSAYGEDSIYVPLFTYRTGPFAGSGTPSPTACMTISPCSTSATAASAASS